MGVRSESGISPGVTEDSVMLERRGVEGTESGGPMGEGAGREDGTSRRLSLGIDLVTDGPRSISERALGEESNEKLDTDAGADGGSGTSSGVIGCSEGREDRGEGLG